MIIVERRLQELFDTLPPIIDDNGKEFKPTFNFGTHEDLLRFLNHKKKQSVAFYPVIWLETPFTMTGFEHRKSFDLKLVFAQLSNYELSNKQRLQITFEKTLEPLYQNVLKALKESGFTRIIDNENNKSTNYYNYSVVEKGKDKQFASDIWDAIKFECELQIDATKIKRINY